MAFSNLSRLVSALLLLLSLPTTQAWNTDVHCQIGHMATELLSPSVHSILLQILSAEPYYKSLGATGAWADAFAHTAEGRFSARWHWIDSNDNPPEQCSVSFPADCGPGSGGCVVSALANQTAALQRCVQWVKAGQPVPEGEATSCVRALKWVIHFVGDVAQPLHASGRLRGGNGQNVTFGGRGTELHAVWDGHLIYSYAQTRSRFSQLALAPYFRGLLTRIQLFDDFQEPTSSFVDCSNPSSYTAQTCALSWALDSNRLDCLYVWKHDFANGAADLLEDGYAERVRPVVEMQVAKAALRLGTWLNRIVMDEMDLEQEEDSGRNLEL